MSGPKVEAVLAAYPTPAALHAAYAALARPAAQGPALLEGLPVPGQKRRLGPTAAGEVFAVVFGAGGGARGARGGGTSGASGGDDGSDGDSATQGGGE